MKIDYGTKVVKTTVSEVPEGGVFRSKEDDNDYDALFVRDEGDFESFVTVVRLKDAEQLAFEPTWEVEYYPDAIIHVGSHGHRDKVRAAMDSLEMPDGDAGDACEEVGRAIMSVLLAPMDERVHRLVGNLIRIAALAETAATRLMEESDL